MVSLFLMMLRDVLEHLRLIVLLIILDRSIVATVTAWTPVVVAARATVITAWSSVVVTTWPTAVTTVIVATRTPVATRTALRLHIAFRLLDEGLA